MYQFYYAEPESRETPQYQRKLSELFRVRAVRPTMWEEHCLECAAPLCFESCAHYEARADGRCKRFANGISLREEERGCCGQAARVRFRRWGNLMTVLYPSMMSCEEYAKMVGRNRRLGNTLRAMVKAPAPVPLRWQSIRSVEYLRRRKLRRLKGESEGDAFVFHGYSFEKESFRLILEIFRDDRSVFRQSLLLQPGENLLILEKNQLSEECWRPNNLVKVYPENNLEAELEILWCDFVKGEPVSGEKPAPKLKCVVWDLDNTLWDGVLIESEAETLALRPGVEELIRALDERGILQSVASKNDYEAAWPVVERMGLAEYFLCPQIHWNAKSASIQEIAKRLNIGTDTFALLDDSVFEREQVRSTLPQVRTYDVSEIPTLLARPEFSVVVTEESRNRRQMYRAEEKRQEVMASDGGDTVDFLRKCHLKATVFRPESEQERLRSYELLTRTNQLNMSGRKYSQTEFHELLRRGDAENLAFSCRDDFGEYGIVGFAQYRKEGGTLIISEFAMSCRVAGKCVENAFFAALLERENCPQGRMTVIKTRKNSLLRRSLLQAGFTLQSEGETEADYLFRADLRNKDLVEVVFDT